MIVEAFNFDKSGRRCDVLLYPDDVGINIKKLRPDPIPLNNFVGLCNLRFRST